MEYHVLKCNVKSKAINEENYGVLIIMDDDSREYICNISDCVEDVEMLVNKMNNYNIEPRQAKEVIEDFCFNK